MQEGYLVTTFFLFLHKNIFYGYSKCPKISYTKVSDKMAYANCADTDQTAEGLHCLPFH